MKIRNVFQIRRDLVLGDASARDVCEFTADKDAFLKLDGIFQEIEKISFSRKETCQLVQNNKNGKIERPGGSLAYPHDFSSIS